MREVLISIQPKWCELIASGKKTVEVRKTRPKIDTPFKVYIYCSEKDYDKVFCIDKFMHRIFLNGNGKQKVIGEFVCDSIMPYCRYEIVSGVSEAGFEELTRATQLSRKELYEYCGEKDIYCWHISDLVIYDKPKELSEFFHYCGDNPKCEGCEAHYYNSTECGTEDYCCSVIEGCKPLKRPFQSWGYVELLKGGAE